MIFDSELIEIGLAEVELTECEVIGLEESVLGVAGSILAESAMTISAVTELDETEWQVINLTAIELAVTRPERTELKVLTLL
jgi:hypothetical protein